MWGLEVNYDGSLIQLVLAAGRQLLSFQQDSFAAAPRLLWSFDLFEEFIDQPDLEVNSLYVTCLYDE